MDFNAIVNMMREIEPTDIANPNADAPKADTKPAVVLSEAAQLRVKAGISTVLAESKKVEEAVEMCPEACCGKPVTECACGPDCKHCDCHAKNAEMKEGKMPQAAIDALQKKNGKKSKKTGDDQKDESKKESTETKAKKFDEEVEDILKAAESKLVKEGTVDTATSVAQELKKMGVSSNASEDEIYKMIPKALKSLNLGSVLKQMNMSKGYKQDMVSDILGAFSGVSEANESKLVKEAKKKMPDYPDVDGDGNKKEPIEKAQKDKEAKGGTEKKPASKGLSAKQKRLPAGLQKAIAKKKGKTESVVTTKKAVAESMTFLDAIKIVKESNGEMKVNAVDTAIWNWAKRVAASKVTEGGIKQEAFAAKVYESKGGVWDVTSSVITE